MSTRSQVIIKDEYDEQWFYRHSDGYPTRNLPALFKLMTWYHKGLIRQSVEQSSGWLVLIGAEEYGYNYDYKTGKKTKKKTITKPIKKDMFDGWKYGAYEICPHKEPHGDIQWLYTIDITKNSINIKEVRSGMEMYFTFEELKEYKDDWGRVENLFS